MKALDNPDTLTLSTTVVASALGRQLLGESPLYPGGGGQLADRGLLRWASGESAVIGFDLQDGEVRHLLADTVELPSGPVEAAVNPAFRQLMRKLHTGLHVVDAAPIRFPFLNISRQALRYGSRCVGFLS